jgi:predicted PolB exonuclease-like 3'-5' exonuclease
MGCPGKLGMDGGAVWQSWCEGRIDEIRDYCETDVVNTYLVYLRFQQMRGAMTPAEHEAEVVFVREQLAATGAPHWGEFLSAWPS